MADTLKWISVPRGGSLQEANYAVDEGGYDVLGMTAGHSGDVWLLLKLRPLVTLSEATGQPVTTVATGQGIGVGVAGGHGLAEGMAVADAWDRRMAGSQFGGVILDGGSSYRRGTSLDGELVPGAGAIGGAA